MTLFAIQIATSIITIWASSRHLRFGFLFTFLIVLNILLIYPFFLIHLDLTGQMSVYSALRTDVDQHVTLQFNTSNHPLIYMLLGQWAILAGYLAISALGRETRLLPPRPMLELHPFETPVVKKLTLALASVCLSYIAVRFAIQPDYPIIDFLLEGGGQLRDIAYEYGISREIYIFRPSIVQQFTRIGIPLAALYAFILWRNQSLHGIFLIFIVSLAIFLAIGTFKRTPLVYLALWGFLFISVLNPKFKPITIMKFALLAFAGTALMTVLYSHNFGGALNSILVRILIGEARGQYLAFLHYGPTFEFEHLNLVQDYARKVLGQDVMAFSERWKIATGGTRGFTSIGAVTETYVSFGYAGLILLVGFGAVLGQMDRLAVRYMTPVTRPIITGMIGVVAFSATKGVLSQLFTGGTLFLLSTFILVLFMTRGHKAVGS